MLGVEEAIWRHAAQNPHKTAVVSGKDSATYGQLAARIAATKEYLKKLPGYAPGKAVVLAANKQIEFIYAYFGAHLAGLTVVPIDSETNPTRFSFITETIKPICVIGFDKEDCGINKISLREFKHFNEIEAAATPPAVDFPDKDATADILFTTGTTGTPKGVPLTFVNEAASARNINCFIQNGENDVELLALPISHSFGLGRVRCCLLNGQKIILLGS
ncbi:MAG: acyl--CoA ligase, partial [Muribaculaceae bacterium]|nr:acyl--CoA ligase [Muribaculaceae bacterium]